MNFYSTLSLHISEALRYGPCVTRVSHSFFTCHPHTNHTCLYSPAARHHRPLDGTHCAYPWRDGQAETKNLSLMRWHNKNISRSICCTVHLNAAKEENQHGATYNDHLRLIGKCVVDFLLVFIELFSNIGVMAEALRAIISSKSAISLQRGPVDQKFQVEGVAPTNHSPSQKTRINVLSHDIKI